MKHVLLSLMIVLAFCRCARQPGSEQHKQLYDAKKLIANYQLVKVDFLRRCEDCKGFVYNNKDNWASPALLVVTSMKGDTILTHIGEKWHLPNIMFFKRDGNYFMISNGSYNEKPVNFNSNSVMRVNHKRGTLESVNEFDMEIFTQYLSTRIDTSQIKTPSLKWRYDEQKKQIVLLYTVTKDTLDESIDYVIEAPMLLNKTGATYTITAKPDSLFKQKPDSNDDSRQLVTRKHLIKKFDRFSLFYDCVNCRQTYSEAIEVYAMVGEKKIPMLTQSFGDMYFAGAEVFTKNGIQFLYIGSGHTYGHEQSYLYSIDTANMLAHKVNVIESKSSELPEGYSPYKSFGLQRNERGDFYDSMSIRAEDGDISSIRTNFKLLKVSEYVYMLEPEK